jgi:hypothetical protein
MDEQEQQNKSDSFLKQQTNKGKDIAKEQAKKQVKKKIMSFIMKNPKVALIVAAVILVIILLIVLLAGAIYLISLFQAEDGSIARQESISFALSDNSVTAETEEIEEQKRITISKSEDNNYQINNNYTEEELKELEATQNSTLDFSEFSDFEKGIIFAFQENGIDLENYTEDELKCLPAFIKAEGCTQYLDLRENSQKQSGKNVGDYIDSYEPEKMEDLAEDRISGTILVQRTNTSKGTPVTLQYIEETEFQKMIDENNTDVLNYFSMTNSGNLIIAKWNYTKVTVAGDYPDTIPEDQREQPREETMLTTEELNYAETIKNYIMPFDFLLQLLIITEDPEFCLDLVDMVLNSRIIINIQEEQTHTITTQEKKYDVHSKEEKYVTYSVGNNIEEDTILLEKTTDDKENKCTTYVSETFNITIVTETISHSYKYEIIEADTWIAYYINKYDAPEEKVTNTVSDPQNIEEEYKELENIIKNGQDAESDSHVAEFKEDKEQEYKDEIPAPPTVNVSEYTDETKVYKKIQINPTSKYQGSLANYVFERQESVDENGETRYYYNMPNSLNVNTKSGVCPDTVRYYYQKNSSDQYYCTGSNVDSVFACTVSQLQIKPFQKTNLEVKTTEVKTAYETDPEPEKSVQLYAKDEDGELQKFLKVFDENKDARGMLRSVEDWLFEMMEENSNTTDLIPIVKYLLYLYDGIDRGVTDLDLSIFEPGEFRTMSRTMNLAKYLIQFSHGTEAPQTPDKKFYKLYGDTAGWPTIGNADLQWKSNHTKFNCEGLVLENGVEKTVPNVQEYVNQKLGGPGVELSDAAVDALNIYIEVELVDRIGEEVQSVHYNAVESATRGLDLSKQQMYALIAINYNFGHLPTRNGYTFKTAYIQGATMYEINSWEHNRFIWDNWWCYIGGGSTAHIPARDAAFETYVKGVFDFSNSPAGQVFSRSHYIYYTSAQKAMFSYAKNIPVTRNTSNEEEIFTYVQGVFGGEILEVCEQIMNELIDRRVRYSTENLIWFDIEASYDHPYWCCATYVTAVLWKAGLLEEDFINKYEYHSCWRGVSPMLKDAGWILVGAKNSKYNGTQGTIALADLEPGDVIIDTGHVVIYAGDNYFYDQNCGVISASGRAPIGDLNGPATNRLAQPNVEVWRAP